MNKYQDKTTVIYVDRKIKAQIAVLAAKKGIKIKTWAEEVFEKEIAIRKGRKDLEVLSFTALADQDITNIIKLLLKKS